MTVFCRLCHQAIKARRKPSAPPETEASLTMAAMAEHLVAAHKPAAEALNVAIRQLSLALPAFLMVKEYVTIPADETELLDHFHGMAQALYELISDDAIAGKLS